MIELLVLMFILGFCAIYAVFLAAADPGRQNFFGRLEAAGAPEQPAVPAGQGAGAARPLSRIENAIRLFQFHGYVANQLRLANMNLRVSEFITVILLITTFPPLAVYLLSRNSGLATIMVCAGAAAPVIYLKYMRSARRKAFNNQLLDTLALISNSLKSGFSLLQAMDLVGREMPRPTSEEFRKALLEIKYGAPFEKTMEGLVVRMASDDFDLVVTSMMIQRQVGGNLADILDRIAHTIRERIRVKGQVRSQTAQGRMSGMVLSLLPVALLGLLLLVNPDYIMPLFREPMGQSLLGAGAVSQIIGIMVIRKIVDVKV